MSARSAAHSDRIETSKSAIADWKQAWAQNLLLFAFLFAVLMLLHAPLLRLPYFWDEAGYYIPAARDLLLTGSLIPHSTPSNAHPPLVMAWLALAWWIFGYSSLVTRTAMLVISAFSLVGLFRLARTAANAAIAWATIALVALYPVYFTQSSMAQVDLPAAGFTFWALASYLNSQKSEDAPWRYAVWFALAALAKETAVLAPFALCAWEIKANFFRPFVKESRWKNFLPPYGGWTNAFYLTLSIIPLASWYAFHYLKTGYLFGNPEFFRYNVAATFSPLRIPIALLMRLWQVFGYFGLYLLTLAGLLAMLRSRQNSRGAADTTERPRISFWVQTMFLGVLLTYLAFMSIVGGAVLARYMLPVVPLVVLALVSTLWRRVKYWKWIVSTIALAFVAGLFSNPPYGFSLEDNLAYRDYILMHAEASRYLSLRYPGTRVLTAWPASDELSRPWLGYVARPFPVVRVEDFSIPQISLAATVRDRFDVAIVFSTKYQPPHSLLEDWAAWQHVKEKFFGYHRDLIPEDIAQQLGGTIAYHTERNGQWIAVIAMEREKDAKISMSRRQSAVNNPPLHSHQVAGMRFAHDRDFVAVSEF